MIEFGFLYTSFDYWYRIVSLILNSASAIFLFYAVLTVSKNPEEFLSKLFIRAKRTIFAFIFLLIAAISIAIGYIITGIVSISNPGTMIWEYTNLIAYFFLTLFSILFSEVNIKLKRTATKTAQETNFK